ncbi:MAG TPA: hypothetical protein PK189_06925 [bacterium]|nr:hypothetical protein [bacterium]
MKKQIRVIIFFSLFLIFYSYLIAAPTQINQFKLYTVSETVSTTPPIQTYTYLIQDTDAKLNIFNKIVVECEVDSYGYIDTKLTTADKIYMQVYNYTNNKYYNFECKQLSRDTTAVDNGYYKYRSDTIDLLRTSGIFDGTGFSSNDSNAIRFFIIVDTTAYGTLLNTVYYVYPGDTQVDSIYFISSPTANYQNYIISDNVIIPDNYVYIVIDAGDRNPYAVKNPVVFITNLTSGETIFVQLTETGNFTNIFLSDAIQLSSSVTDQSTRKLKVNYGDIIKVVLNNRQFSNVDKSDTIRLAVPTSPTNIISLNFKDTNFAYNLDRKVTFNEIMNIEVSAVDENIYTADTIEVLLGSGRDTVTLILTQVATIDGYGIFRNNEYRIGTVNDTVNKILKVQYNDIIKCYVKNYPAFYDTVQVAAPTSPTQIQTLQFKEVGYVSELDRKVNINEVLYIELTAVDLSPLTNDTIIVILGNGQDSFSVELTQTGSSGIYGIFRNNEYKLGSISDTANKTLKAEYNSIIKCYVKDYPTYFDTVQIVVPTTPTQIQTIKFKESGYISNLNRRVNFNERLYIELTAIDESILTNDTIIVILGNGSDSFNVELVQTGLSGIYGIFRNNDYSVDYYFDTVSKVLRVGYDSVVRVVVKDYPIYYDTLQIVSASTAPITVTTIKFKDNNFISDLSNLFVRPNDYLYLEITGIDRNEYQQDSIIAYIKSTKYNDSIYVYCIETSNHSGIFRSSNIELNLTTTSTNLKKLRTDYNDTIIAFANGSTLSCTIYTARYTTPEIINNLFFSDQNYNIQMTNSYIDINSNLYITLYAQDASYLTADTIEVIIINKTDDTTIWNGKYWKYSDSITIELKETSENSGKFTSQNAAPKLGEFTNQYIKQLKAEYGDTILVIVFSKTDITKDNPLLIDTIYIYPTNNISIIEPYLLTFYSDMTYTTKFDSYVQPFATIYVELFGRDENPYFVDVISCTVIVNDSGARKIGINLYETSKNSGLFRGQFKINIYTDDIYDVVKADKNNDEIKVYYEGIGTISKTLIVKSVTIPVEIVAINLYSSPSYEPLKIVDDDYEFNFDENIYIELIAIDSNPLTIDNFEVEVYSMKPDGSDVTVIRVQLEETLPNSGIFRNNDLIPDRKSVKLAYLTNDTLNELRVNYGYIIKVVPYSVVSDITAQTKMTIPKQPTFINEFYFYTGSDYSTILPENWQQNVNTEIYMQLTGADGNPKNADTVEIMLVDEYLDANGQLVLSEGDSIVIGLLEISENAGVYRGTAMLRRLSNARYREIGTSEGHFVLCGVDKNGNGRLDWNNNEIYDTVVLAQFDPPDYVYAIDLRTDYTYSASLNVPVLPYQIPKNDIRYAASENLSQLWIEARADSATASNLLNDSFAVEIISFRGDTIIPGLTYSGGYYYFDASKLSNQDFIDSYVLDTDIIVLKEVGGPNSGLYRNYDEITNEYINCVITSNIAEKDNPGRIYIRQKESDNTYGDTILVRSLVPLDTSDTINPYASSYKTATAYTRSATKLSPIKLDYIRLYDSSNYVNPIIDFQRSFEEPFDALYIQVKSADAEGFANDVLIDEIDVEVHNLTRSPTDLRGDTKIIVSLIETGQNTNIFRTKQVAYTTAKVISKKHALDFETITRNERGELYCNRGDTIVIIAPTVTFEPNKSDYYYIAQYKAPNPVSISRTNESYSEAITTNYLIDELIYIQVIADRGSIFSSNSILKDTLTVWVKNLNPNIASPLLKLELEETEIGSEIYRVNTYKYPLLRLSTFTLQEANILEAYPGDTIIMWCERRALSETGGIILTNITDTRYVAIESKPKTIYSIEIKTGPDYKIDYKPTDELVYEQIIYVQVRADIGDAALIETTEVWVYHSKDLTDTIEVVLTEEAPASPFYRGTFKIKPLTNDTLDEIGVDPGETIVVKHPLNWNIASPILKIASPTPPSNVNSVAFTDEGYTKKLRDVNGGYVLPYPTDNILYIELNGQDVNERLVDEVYVILKSYKNGNLANLQGAIKVKLTETGTKTGKFHGTVTVSETSDTERIEIRGYFGDVIYVYSLDEIRFDSVGIPLPQQPEYITNIFIKDANYDVDRVNERFGFSDILYIEARGGSGNKLLRDTTAVDVYALDKNQQPLPGAKVRVELVESDIANGIYRGIVKLADNEFAPCIEQTKFFDPLYDRKVASGVLNQAIKKVTIPGVEIPTLGNLRGFRYIYIEWVKNPAQVHTNPQNYIAINNDPGSVSPNPWKSSLHSGQPITFTNLAQNSTVKIYDILGHLIKEDVVTKFYPKSLGEAEFYYEWDLTNKENYEVASGIYIYIIRDKFNKEIKGKLAIIR